LDLRGLSYGQPARQADDLGALGLDLAVAELDRIAER
jgi:hypothetical protein